MLFDLRGRGRRRVVQAIYLTLAILMGGGLVLFGIGGNTDGGLLNAFQDDKQSGNQIVEQRLTEAEAAVRARPQDPVAYAELTRAHYQSAEFDDTTGAFTDKGKQALRAAERSYDRYLTLAGDKPDAKIASLMVQVFSAAGINKPEKAVTAMETVIDNREAPTAALYVQLASLAYGAGQTRKADLASDKALELAPKDDRERIKAQLDALKAQSQQSTPDAATGATTTPSS